MKKVIGFVFGFLGSFAFAQTPAESPFHFSGYLEFYYTYDFGQPATHLRPDFVYSHNRHNEINLNLGMAKINYTKDPVRANFALMAGTYTQHNMAAEPAVLRPLYEANVGVKLSNQHELWLDVGIMPSHIGFESAIGKDCQTLTRSILADNSPYFETGVKVSYASPSGQWYFSGMYLNGWQRIQKMEGNQTPAFGTQIVYQPKKSILFNWSTYVGNEQPNGIEKWRYFSNLYGQFILSDQVNLTSGFDIGIQQALLGSKGFDTWFSPVLILQYQPVKKIKIAARGEYYEDAKGVIITSNTPDGFSTYGFSANIDYWITNKVVARLEGRTFQSKAAEFRYPYGASHSNTFVSAALAIAL